MKKCLLVLSCFVCLSFSVSAQSVEDFVKEGIALYDKGDFAGAIEKYKEALKIDSKSSVVNYEIALAYFQLKDYENTVKHSDNVIKQNKGTLVEAYTIKGSALDDMGKTKDAVEVYKKALKKFPDEYLLHYNLALSNYRLKNYEETQNACIKAISLKNNHASSHILLSYAMNAQGKRVQTILPLYFFLLLEPKTNRSKDALTLLNKQLSKGVSKDENKENTINVNILLPAGGAKDDFGAAEMMISLLEAGKSIEENKDKTEEELFVTNTESLFKMLGELKENEKHKGFWWDLYVDFFYGIADKNHTEAFCYYITQSSEKENVTKWLTDNKEKVNQFAAFLKK